MIHLFAILIVLGVVLYLINAVVPMEPWVKTIINALAALFIALWLLQAFGLYSGFPKLH